MPSYNSESHISESIESVLSQTYQNWELIITDDNSSDSTVDIIGKYLEQDCRIKLLQSNKNCGAGTARNTSIKEARGKFIAFLDSDDLWLPQKLEKQIGFMINNNFSFTYSYYQKFSKSNKGSIIKSNRKTNYEDLICSNVIGCLTAIYDAEILGKMYMPSIRKRQDMALWLEILKITKTAYCIEESLALYRTDTGMTKNKLNVIKSQWYLYRHILKLPIRKSSFVFIKYAIKGTIKHIK